MNTKKKLVLHSCCAPCAAYPYVSLHEDYALTLYFFNPNIFPEREYQIRKEELEAYAKRNGIRLVVEEGLHEAWRRAVAGFEDEPEGGARCARCFAYRLEQTMRFAEADGADSFGTVMSISPHKESSVLNETGAALAQKSKIGYYEANFKKQDGFRRSCEISKREGFYRQNYCGCEFSIRS